MLFLHSSRQLLRPHQFTSQRQSSPCWTVLYQSPVALISFPSPLLLCRNFTCYSERQYSELSSPSPISKPVTMIEYSKNSTEHCNWQQSFRFLLGGDVCSKTFMPKFPLCTGASQWRCNGSLEAKSFSRSVRSYPRQKSYWQPLDRKLRIHQSHSWHANKD